MKSKLRESLRKLIQQEIQAVLYENTNDFKVGEIYRDGDVEYQITTMPDKFKGKYGAGTMNIWVTNLDTEEQHFMPVSVLKTLKQVYVTPPEGRLKHLKASNSREMHEGPEEMGAIQKGDYVKYTNPVNHSKFKKNISFWTNTSKDKNKPFEVYIRDGAIGVVEDIIGNIATVKFSPKWFIPDSVNTNIPYKIYTDYLEVLKNVTGSSVPKPFTGKLDYSKVNEGPEEMGAYRRLVITSPAFEKMKTEFTKFMGRPEVKSMYPVRFKMVDSPKPNTVVVDVEGDKATVVAIKLSDLAKKLDKSVTIMVRKERKLK